MFKRRFRLPSPALVISMIALSLVLGGTAVAASTAKHGDKKADIKLIKKLAPTLSVKHAKSANNATNAANATHATSANSATNATHATSADSAANATTAANANALGGVGASGYVQNSGNIYVSIGYENWVPRSTADPLNITYYSDTAGFERTAIGGSYFTIGAMLPTSLYGKALAFSGFQMCYSTNTGNSISNVFVYQITQTAAGNAGSAAVVTDATSRTDDACRTYSLSSPITMTSSDEFMLYVLGNWTTANTELWLGRVTAILQPTSTAGTLQKGSAHGAKAGAADLNAAR
jgi:hypothetical protein